MIKTLHKKRGNVLNLTKDIYKKPTTNIILTAFIPKVRKKTSTSTSATSIQSCTRISSQYNKSRKGKQIGMEEIKLPLFSDDLIFYRKSQEIYKQ